MSVPGDVDGDGIPDVPGAAAGPDALADFWAIARGHVGLGKLYPILAEDDVTPPQAWAFGDTPELADELLALVLAGTKTGTASLQAEYDEEGVPIPWVGELSIVLDGAGEPRALIRTTEVRVVPFDEVDDEHATAEGEGDGSLAYWRRVHDEVWRRRDPGFDPATARVVAERFELLYSAPAPAPTEP